jgi:DNA adenine methylase
MFKPFVNYSGGKTRLLPYIRAEIPELSDETTYYEPFVGGGAVFLSVSHAKAVVGDTNAELINCYQVIKTDALALIDELKRHHNTRTYYYALRNWDRLSCFSNRTPVERAARTIFLSKACFNGFYRVNKKNQFNTSYGNNSSINLPTAEQLLALSDYLRKTTDIFHADFSDTLSSVRKGDFVYLDPPYDPLSESSSFTEYTSGGFSKAEQERLRDYVDKLTDLGCRVLISNSNTPFIRDLYANYTLKEVSVQRMVSGKASARGTIVELLIRNY